MKNVTTNWLRHDTIAKGICTFKTEKAFVNNLKRIIDNLNAAGLEPILIDVHQVTSKSNQKVITIHVNKPLLGVIEWLRALGGEKFIFSQS